VEFEIPLSAPTQSFLSAHLDNLARLRPEERTLSRLLVFMAEHTRDIGMRAKTGHIDAQGISHRDTDLKALEVLQIHIRQTLHQFAEGGEYGGIFDGTEDVLGAHPVQTFELRSLLQRPRLVGPVLGYVFPELERQMRTDAPMFLLLDDAAVTWLTPRQEATEQHDIRKKLENKCREWLMTSAKKNVSLGFSTHSLSQVFSSALGPLLEEGCPSRFFLPMTAALEPNIAEISHRLGLTENALRTIATSRPQRDVYYACKELGQRSFSLPLGPLGVNCFASNRAEDHALMDALIAKEGPEGFAPAWFRAHNFAEEARYVEEHHRLSLGQSHAEA
jgi:type IV secretory pathway VirB4 component